MLCYSYDTFRRSVLNTINASQQPYGFSSHPNALMLEITRLIMAVKGFLGVRLLEIPVSFMSDLSFHRILNIGSIGCDALCS